MRNVIISGFDRCGSSMMCGLLAKHPDISMMFQPTNGTEVHQDMLKPWKPADIHTQAYDFFAGLCSGIVDNSFIKRDVFEKHSEYETFPNSTINIIKETKCCMKTGWLVNNFPIEVFGIWRNPRAILCSLVKNDFHIKWYGDKAFTQVLKLVHTDNKYNDLIVPCGSLLTPAYKMAIVIAASLIALKDSLLPNNWLVYEEVVRSPNECLNDFIHPFGLDYFDFSQYTNTDFNVSGEDFNDKMEWYVYFSKEEITFIDNLFGFVE